MFNRPWLLMPVPAEWKREGDVTKVTRYQKFRVDIHDVYSIDNIPLDLFELMRLRDEEEAAAHEAAMEAARAGGND